MHSSSLDFLCNFSFLAQKNVTSHQLIRVLSAFDKLLDLVGAFSVLGKNNHFRCVPMLLITKEACQYFTQLLELWMIFLTQSILYEICDFQILWGAHKLLFKTKFLWFFWVRCEEPFEIV